MEKIKNFYELDAWKKAHLLAINIYKITKSFPKEELYGVSSQIRRAVSSITANIAEGFSRYHFAEKAKFYYNARASASEVQNFLLLSKDLGYIDKKSCEDMFLECVEIGKLINGLIRSIDNQKRV